MNADGVVVIEARLNDIPLEKQLKYVENKLNAFEKQMGKNGFNDLPESTLRQYDELLAKQKEITNQISKQNASLKENNIGKWVDGVYELSDGTRYVKNNIEGIKEDTKKIDFSQMNNQIKNVGNSLTKVIKKVGKWALAVFGLRSMYMAVRRAASTVSQYNEQIATDLSYIQYALSSALEPLIRIIINMAYSLLSVINSITTELFNYNLFLNASVKNFNKMNKSAGELKKTLAGFDKLNIIQKPGAGGSSYTPTLDLSEITQTESGNKFVKFWQKIIKFWEEDWIHTLDNIKGNWKSFLEGIMIFLKGFYDSIKGFVQIFVGLWKVLVAIFNEDLDGLYDALKLMLDGAKKFILGLIEIIAGALLAVLGVIKGLLLDLVKGIYNSVIVPIGNFFVKLWDGIKKGAQGLVNGLKTIFNSLKDIIKVPLNFIIDGINKIISGLNSLSIKIPSWVPKVGGQTWGINISKVPRLAKGGIVNMPGRGINYGGANIAEKSAEAIVPFSDPQQMEILGQSIGKHVKINADITLELESRVLARVMKEIENNYSFARNGG